MSKSLNHSQPKWIWLLNEPILLASQSKIRSEILAQANIPHIQLPSMVEERDLESKNPKLKGRDLALYLAQRKALSVSDKNPDRLVLAADQICLFQGKTIHKAVSLEELRLLLSRMRGNTHTLVSAATVAFNGQKVFDCCDEASMTMRRFSDSYLQHYLDIGGDALLQSVGGYMIEGLGITLFDKIDGAYHTILGLPILPILEHLRKIGALAS